MDKVAQDKMEIWLRNIRASLEASTAEDLRELLDQIDTAAKQNGQDTVDINGYPGLSPEKALLLRAEAMRAMGSPLPEGDRPKWMRKLYSQANLDEELGWSEREWRRSKELKKIINTRSALEIMENLLLLDLLEGKREIYGEVLERAVLRSLRDKGVRRASQVTPEKLQLAIEHGVLDLKRFCEDDATGVQAIQDLEAELQEVDIRRAEAAVKLRLKDPKAKLSAEGRRACQLVNLANDRGLGAKRAGDLLADRKAGFAWAKLLTGREASEITNFEGKFVKTTVAIASFVASAATGNPVGLWVAGSRLINHVFRDTERGRALLSSVKRVSKKIACDHLGVDQQKFERATERTGRLWRFALLTTGLGSTVFGAGALLSHAATGNISLEGVGKAYEMIKSGELTGGKILAEAMELGRAAWVNLTTTNWNEKLSQLANTAPDRAREMWEAGLKNASMMPSVVTDLGSQVFEQLKNLNDKALAGINLFDGQEAYTVKPGDTLTGIAVRLLQDEGVEITNELIVERVKEIAELNNIENINNIKAGLTIELSGTPRRAHQI